LKKRSDKRYNITLMATASNKSSKSIREVARGEKGDLREGKKRMVH